MDAFDYMVKIVTSDPYNHYAHLGLDGGESVIVAPSAKACNSDGVKESWAEPGVAAARLTRQKVEVTKPDGTTIEFKSLKEAFIGCRLPIEKHIRFRLKLKASGAEGFDHGGRVYAFRIV